MPTKETICTNCNKRNVCKFKDDFMVAVEAYQNIRIPDIFHFTLECREWVDSSFKHGTFKRS